MLRSRDGITPPRCACSVWPTSVMTSRTGDTGCLVEAAARPWRHHVHAARATPTRSTNLASWLRFELPAAQDDKSPVDK